MAGFVVERHGYATGAALAADVIVDMLANGFELINQTSGEPSFNKATAGNKFCVILEATVAVDPLAASQPWRIAVDVQEDQLVLVHTGSPTTLSTVDKLPVTKELLLGNSTQGAGWQPTDIVGTTGDKLTVTKTKALGAPSEVYDYTARPDPSLHNKIEVNGYVKNETLSNTGIYSPSMLIPAMMTDGDKNPDYNAFNTTSPWFLDNENLRWSVNPSGTVTGSVDQTNSNDDTTKGFINRIKRIGTSNPEAFPMTYRLVISNRGVWLGIWEEATTQEGSRYFNWVLVQRPVDRVTGATVVDGKAPVFCVNAVGGKFWKFVVREMDIMRPSARIQADLDTEDSEAILNSANQVSLSEDGKYIITFPSRLNTSRYRYPHELDMIASTSADVVSQNTDVDITVYGESTARKYKALHANGPANTGMRLMVLSKGGSIS
jgi:hypothetical protein